MKQENYKLIMLILIAFMIQTCIPDDDMPSEDTQMDEEPITDGLIAKYTFDETDLGKDVSGNDNDGTPNNITYGTQRITGNQTASFNGINSYIEVDAFKSLEFSEITIIAWVNIHDWVESCGGNWAPILSKTTSSSTWGEFDIQLSKEIGYEFIYREDNFQGSFDFNLNEWYFIAATYKNGIGIQYINDQVICHFKNVSPFNSFEEPLRIGNHPSGCDEFLNGSIDEFRVFDRALSEDEIMQVYEYDLDGENPLSVGGLPNLTWMLEEDIDKYEEYSQNQYFVFGDDWLAGTANLCNGSQKIHVAWDIHKPNLSQIHGDEVYAVYDGFVSAVYSAGGSFGTGITIEHTDLNGNKFTSNYIHIDPENGLDGTNVSAGQLIGHVSDLVDPEPDHLHFSIRKSSYSNIANRGALPRNLNDGICECDNDPVFPEKFIDPGKVKFNN